MTVKKLYRKSPVQARADFINSLIRKGASYAQAVRAWDNFVKGVGR